MMGGRGRRDEMGIAHDKEYSRRSINQSMTGWESVMLEVIRVPMHSIDNSKVIFE